MTLGWAKIPERGPVWGMRFVLGVSRVCGYRLGYWMLYPIVFSLLFFYSQGRSSSLSYLCKIGLLHESDGLVRTFLSVFRHHFSFAVNAYDRVWLAQNRLDLFDLQLRNGDLIERFAKEKRGAILVSCHIGSFEVMRALSTAYRVEVVPVMYGASSRKFMETLQKVNPQYRMDVIFMEEHGAGSILLIQQAVAQGKMVAIMGDRIPPGTTRLRVANFDFLGQLANFNLNPWIVASVLHCPVLFTVGVRVGLRQYKVSADLLTENLIRDRRKPDQGLTSVMELFVRQMEQLCHNYPLQWFNFFDFWRQHHE
ncbi:MAG TPA: hypothetical protein VLM37_12795 [Fibrobacteraceae bacterium]|nr:hypothetical protein [Fibrobacteraceae bacterium]